MRFSMVTRFLCVFLFLVMIVGCGGGSDSSTDDETTDTTTTDTNTDDASSDGTSSITASEAEALIGAEGLVAITEAEFEACGGEGVWRFIGEMSGDFIFTEDGYSSEAGFEYYRYVTAVAEKTIDGETYYDQCSLDGFELSETEEEEEWCDDATVSYFTSSDGSFAYLVVTCGSGGITIYEWTMLSDEPVFDLGSAAVTFDTYTDVSSESGICGSLMGLEEEIEIAYSEESYIVEDLSEYEITVRLPYQDNYILLIFSFPDEPAVGEYDLVSSSYNAESGQASLNVQSGSSEFGSGISAEEAAVYSSESGTLTLTSIGDTYAAGSFSATIEIDGEDLGLDEDFLEDISGSFSIAIE